MMAIMARARWIVLALSAGLTMLVWTGAANAVATLEQQRADFLDARKALKKGQIRDFRRISKRLQDYPLQPYLEYEFLRKRLSKTPNSQVRAFLVRYQDTPVADRLRKAWLRSLAKKKQWDTFLAEYDGGGGVRLRCLRARALFNQEKIEEAMDATEILWLVGKSQSSSCDPAFTMWQEKGGMTPDLVWKRIELAMARGQISLARYLAKKLPEDKREWVEQWRKMHRNPAANLLRDVYQQDSPIARQIVRHGIKRLARRDVGAAADVWAKLRPIHKAKKEPTDALDGYIALRGAFQKHPQALTWLSELKAPSDKARDWQIRVALSGEDWWSALTWIDALPEEDRNSERWRYWRARILEMQSETVPALGSAAERIYTELAGERSYHGFLAADRLGLPYQFRFSALTFKDEELKALENVEAIQRARELYLVGMSIEARREWFYVTATMDETTLRKASVLASRWGWHDRAIMTVAKGDHFDDLDIRFPMAFRDLIESHAKEQVIDPAWVYGVVRQESGFMADARSGAGALGLMQLMPATGRLTAKALKSRIRSNRDILDVNKNIRLGAAYLKQMYDRYEGNPALATASYNAGPHRVKRWLPEREVPADLWVETIPYTETRKYVRRVMAYTVIYDYRLDGKMEKLSNRMPKVLPNG